VPPLLPPVAVIELTFSPVVTIGAFGVRLETVALAAVILAALLVAARIARRTPVDPDHPPDAVDPDTQAPNRLRSDDLLYIAVAALPGAVVLGRVGYVLTHLDYYSAHPEAVVDLGHGGLELSLAVVGGTLTAALVVSLLGSPVGRWLHAAILPLLLAIAGGKLAMVLGGDGQGLPWDGTWATAYLGPGRGIRWRRDCRRTRPRPTRRWRRRVCWPCWRGCGAGRLRPPARRAYLLGIAMWCVARAVVATTWRDPVTHGDLRADQVLTLAVAGGALVVLVVMGVIDTWRQSRRPAAANVPGTGPAGGEPDWPDPSLRPRL